MPNQVEFIEPIPVPGAINFALSTAPFFAQFMPALLPAGGGVAPLPDPTTPAGQAILISAALDAGYGTFIQPIPSLSAADLAQLQQQLLAQKNVVESLLERNAAGQTVLRPVMRMLEKNGKSPNSFALGTLYARVATELWVQANAWPPVQRFWHFSVLEQSMANFVTNQSHNSYNPDFLVMHGNNLWACVEAKGTLEGLDLARMKSGLYQACKLTLIQWQPPLGALQTVVPNMQVCTMAYFDQATGTLEVRHLDPPARQMTPKNPDRMRPVLFLEGGDFYRWSQAILQFENLAESPAPSDLEDGEMDWAQWSDASNAWIGIPRTLRRYRAMLNWASELLSWLIPTLGRWRDKSLFGSNIEDDFRRIPGRLRRMTAYARRRSRTATENQGLDQGTAWLLLGDTLRTLARNEIAPSWSTTLSRIWEAPILGSLTPDDRDPNFEVTSLAKLWHAFGDAQRSFPVNWILNALLPVDSSRPNLSFQSKITSHGLLVVVTGNSI